MNNLFETPSPTSPFKLFVAFQCIRMRVEGKYRSDIPSPLPVDLLTYTKRRKKQRCRLHSRRRKIHKNKYYIQNYRQQCIGISSSNHVDSSSFVVSNNFVCDGHGFFSGLMSAHRLKPMKLIVYNIRGCRYRIWKTNKLYHRNARYHYNIDDTLIIVSTIEKE